MSQDQEDPAIKAAHHDGFTMGTIAALGVVTAYDNPTIWKDIVRAAGTQEILQRALTEEGDWEWAGFAKYAVTELGRKEVAKAKRAVRSQRMSQRLETAMTDGATKATAPSSNPDPL